MIGADGFVGSNVVACALAAGASVAAVCVKDAWRLAAIADERLGVLLAADWHLHVPPADVVVLLAYEPPPSKSVAAWLEHELVVNAERTVSAARVAVASGARVIFASSADVYGAWHDRPVDEGVPPEPGTPYAKAKLATEERLASEADDLAIIRLGTVYGPSEHPRRAIPAFIAACARGEAAVVHGDGSDVRDYVYVGDVAASVLSCVVRRPDAAVFNIGSGVGRTTLEVLRAVAGVMGMEPNARFEPSERSPSRLVLDVTRARKELGLHCGSDFEAGLREEVEWLGAAAG